MAETRVIADVKVDDLESGRSDAALGVDVDVDGDMDASMRARIATLRGIEAANPWMTKVSVLLPKLKTDDELDQIKDGKTRGFYEQQNELIRFYEERYVVGSPVKKSEDEEEEHSALARLAINMSFGLNVVLVMLYTTVLIITGSVAMFASVLDSCLDVLSGMVLFLTRRAIDRTDPYRYPQGKRRLEPVGALIFACVMSVASLQILKEAIQRLADGFHGDVPHVHVDLAVKVIVPLSVASKLLMGAFCQIVAKRTNSTGVKCYATDHINDVCLNSVGLGGMMMAAMVPQAWFVDPMAAIVISVLILYSWITTGVLHMDQIVGRTADYGLLRKITFVALNHDKDIQFVDTTRAYHFGERVLAEVDVVLPGSMPLLTAHDIGESLQIKLEELEEVERAFCHLDYEYDHKPEHPPVK